MRKLYRQAGLIFFLALLPCPSFAEPSQTLETKADPEATSTFQNYVNLRGGASSGNQNGRPEICLEAGPSELISIEGCGTGSGFLHNDPATAMTHFRTKIHLKSWKTRFGWLQSQAGIGFAELQLGADEPGFMFTSTGSRGIETAGPEAGISVRALMPTKAGVEFLAELNFSTAWMPHAGALSTPASVIQPTTAFTLGIGF